MVRTSDCEIDTDDILIHSGSWIRRPSIALSASTEKT